MVFTINVINIGHIGHDIGWYYKLNIVSGTSNTRHDIAEYVSELVDTWNNGLSNIDENQTTVTKTSNKHPMYKTKSLGGAGGESSVR